MSGFHQARDEESGPIYGMTCEFATMEPPPLELLQLFGAIDGNQDATDDFVSVMAGTLPGCRFPRARKRRPPHGDCIARGPGSGAGARAGEALGHRTHPTSVP
jgi:hypothetical protein